MEGRKNEYYYKIYPKDLCKFFNIKYKWYDKISIYTDIVHGEQYLKILFKYKTIFIVPDSIKKFLKYKGYNRLRTQYHYDNFYGKYERIYGVLFK